MQNRFTNPEKDAIRLNYAEHPLYLAADSTLSAYDSKLQDLCPSAEELCYEVARILDDVKEQGDAFHPDKLWKKLMDEGRNMDPSIGQPERQLFVCLTVTLASISLIASSDGTHQLMAEEIMLSAKQNYDMAPKVLQEVYGTCRYLDAAITQWMLDFMRLDNDEYLSDAMRQRMTKAEPPAQESQFSLYIRRGSKVKELLDWLHRAVDVQDKAKEQLAPIKAAMECRPQALSYNLPLEVFNQEFHLAISEDTWKDWIKGYHNKSYIQNDVDELAMYKDELAEIMS